MESYSFVSIYENYEIPVQLLKLKDSLFIYVGTKSMNFDNLSVSTYNNENSSCYTILDEEYSEVGKGLANKLSIFKYLN